MNLVASVVGIHTGTYTLFIYLFIYLFLHILFLNGPGNTMPIHLPNMYTCVELLLYVVQVCTMENQKNTAPGLKEASS